MNEEKIKTVFREAFSSPEGVKEIQERFVKDPDELLGLADAVRDTDPEMLSSLLSTDEKTAQAYKRVYSVVHQQLKHDNYYRLNRILTDLVDELKANE